MSGKNEWTKRWKTKKAKYLTLTFLSYSWIDFKWQENHFTFEYQHNGWNGIYPPNKESK
jgi:hypothetical protein